MLPAVYINFAHFIVTDGMFRITLFDQQLLKDAEGKESMSNNPRVSVICTPAFVGELIKVLGEFQAKVSRGEGHEAAAKSDTLQ
jgi:hypothetical protein